MRFACLLLCACATTRPALDGLWGVEHDFGPPGGAGTLRVTRPWQAQLGAASAPLVEEGGELRGRFPGGAEVRLRSEGAVLRGHWIQPPGTSINQRYATPITLGERGGVWTTEIRPQRDLIRHYLTIQGRTAWVRETELNLGIFFGDLTVEGTDAALTFRKADGSVVFTATRAGDRLTLHIADVGLDLVHTRRGRENAPGFYPRPPGTYRYQPPPARDDGWPVASLADVGLDPAPITRAVAEIAGALPTSQRSPAVHALLIARHGKLVLEEYFAGHSRDDLHDLRSAGKSFTTTLLGIAIDRGLTSLDEPFPLAPGDDPRRGHLRVAHLASMSSGLDCDDDDPKTPGNEDVMQGQKAVPDWYAYMTALRLVREPGEKGVYCTGAINLIGAVLVQKTGRWIPDLFAEWIAGPLQFGEYHLNLMPTGEGYLGGGLRLRPRDFAKLGQLFVAGGVWRGRRVVSAAWVATASAPHASLNEPDDYGYGWWRRTYVVDGRALAAYWASGNGAQLCIVVPALELVITINAGNYGYAKVRRQLLDELVPKILAAAT